MFSYLIVLSRTDQGYSAYFPDLPGLIIGGNSIEEILEIAPIATRAHFQGLREIGEPIPKPVSVAETIQVPIEFVSNTYLG